jgi:hypothetical protein
MSNLLCSACGKAGADCKGGLCRCCSSPPSPEPWPELRNLLNRLDNIETKMRRELNKFKTALDMIEKTAQETKQKGRNENASL